MIYGREKLTLAIATMIQTAVLVLASYSMPYSHFLAFGLCLILTIPLFFFSPDVARLPLLMILCILSAIVTRFSGYASWHLFQSVWYNRGMEVAGLEVFLTASAIAAVVLRITTNREKEKQTLPV